MANSAFSDPKLHSLDHFPYIVIRFFSSQGKECTLIQVWKAWEGGFFHFTFFQILPLFLFLPLCNSQLTFLLSYFIDLSHGVLWKSGLVENKVRRHHQPAPLKAFPSCLIYSQVLVFWSYAPGYWSVCLQQVFQLKYATETHRHLFGPLQLRVSGFLEGQGTPGRQQLSCVCGKEWVKPAGFAIQHFQ